MLPAFTMALSHLRFQESSEDSVYRPPDTITLLHPQLNYKLVSRKAVNVHPDTSLHNFIQLSLCMLILHKLSSSRISPKLITTSVSMLAPSPCPHRQLRQILWIIPHQLFRTEHNVGFIESVLHLLNRRPGNLLARNCFAHTEHREQASGVELKK